MIKRKILIFSTYLKNHFTLMPPPKMRQENRLSGNCRESSAHCHLVMPDLALLSKLIVPVSSIGIIGLAQGAGIHPFRVTCP